MPFILKDNSHKIAVTDKITGEIAVFEISRPNSEQRRKYNDGIDSVECGLDIIKGITEGDFLISPMKHQNADNLKERYVTVDGEHYLTISSDPSSEYYMTNWKDLLREHADFLIDGIVEEFFKKFVVVEKVEENEISDIME